MNDGENENRSWDENLGDEESLLRQEKVRVWVVDVGEIVGWCCLWLCCYWCRWCGQARRDG